MLKKIGSTQLLLLLQLATQTHGQLLELMIEYKTITYQIHTLIFIICAVLMGVLFQLIVKKMPGHISAHLLVIVVGILFGIWSNHWDTLRDYTQCISVIPFHLVANIAPALMFHLAFNVDAHTFTRSWHQIIICSILGVIINSTIIGMLMKLVIGKNWSFSQAVMFGLLATPVYPQSITGMLKDFGYQTKHAISLLDGESMGLLMFVVVVFRIVDDIDQNVETEPSIIALTIFWYPVIGISIGLTVGYLTCILVHCRNNSAVNVILWTICIPYLTYYVAEAFCKCSGIAAVVCIGVMLSLERRNLTPEVDQLLVSFWDLLMQIVNSWVSLMIGVFFTRDIAHFLSLPDYLPIVVTYVVASVSRFISLFLMAPIISRMGYGFTMNKLILIGCGNIRSQICCVIAWVGMYNSYNAFGVQLAANINGLFILTLLINVTTLPYILGLINMGQLSNFRKSNMNNCFKHVMEARDRAMAMLKMDRFLSDANWPWVQKYSVIKHPYKTNVTKAGEDDKNDIAVFGSYSTTCPDCFKEVISEPTKSELKDMKKEARLRILKAKKISYMKQYEKGLLSKDGLRVLSASVESATESKDVLVDLEGLYKLFVKKSFAYFVRRYVLDIFINVKTIVHARPHKPCRRFCYRIVMHPAYEIVMAVIILCNIIPIALTLYYHPPINSELHIALITVNEMYLLIYSTELVIKVLAYSTRKVFWQGVHNYFKSWWNVFDFSVLMLAMIDVTMALIVTYVFTKESSSIGFYAIIMKCLRCIRLLRVFRLLKAWYPHIVRYFDLKVDMHVAFTYEIGKGFVKGEEEVLELLPQMVDNDNIREELGNAVEADKLAITRELGLIQKEKPWIAITVKTRQAMRSTLNSMMEGIVELKVAGWVDDYEHQKLVDALNERIRFVNNTKSVPPCPPKVIFSEVAWMAGDSEVSEYLYENVHSKLYDAGDYLCSEGHLSEGILIVVSGLLKLTYNPKPESLDHQAENGCLPIVDYVAPSKFHEKTEEYIISGNTIGELCTLTKRAYDCDIVAETQAQVYVLSHDVILKALQINEDALYGLEARLWRSVSIRIALSILMGVPAYQSVPQEKIKMILDRSFVPNLSHFKIFTVNDMIEDIVLIEGVVIDYNSKESFFGPCYIYRTVQRLVLSSSSLMTIITPTKVKLLIIPTKDVSEYEVMKTAEEISMLNSEERENFEKRISDTKSKKSRKKIHNMGADASMEGLDNESELKSIQMDNRSSLAMHVFANKNKLAAQHKSKRW